MNQEIIACHNMTYDRMAKNTQQKRSGKNLIMYHSYPLSHWVKDSECHRKANVYWLPPWRISFQTQDPKTQERLMPRLADLVTKLLHVSAADARCEEVWQICWFCMVLSFSSVISFWDLWSFFFLMRALWAEGCLLRSAVHQRWP